MCRLKLRLVLHLITWVETELHIITSEHEVLNTLLPAYNPAPHLDTFRTFSPAATCCPSAPVIVFLWWKRSIVTTLLGYHSCPGHTLSDALPSHDLHQVWCPLVMEETPSDRCGQGDFSSSALLPMLFSRFLPPSPLKFEKKVLPLLGQGTMMIMIGHFFPLFSPPPSSWLFALQTWLSGVPDSSGSPKPTLRRWMCPLKPT